MGRRNAVKSLLNSGESVLASGSISGSVDVRTDLPGSYDLLEVHLTNQRLLCLDALARQPALVWWSWLEHLQSVHAEVRWQNRVVNRGRETIVTLHSGSGDRVVWAHNHVVDGRRRTARFVEALERSIGAPPAPWGAR